MSRRELTKDELRKITTELRELHLLTDVDKRPAGYKAWFRSVKERFGDEGADYGAMLLEIQKGHEEVVMPRVGAKPHMDAARPLHMAMVIMFGLIALACIAGGIYSLYRNSLSPTEINVWGLKVSTGSVGVAFVIIGVFFAAATVNAILKNIAALAAIPPDVGNAPKPHDKPKGN